ncbi:T6SS immunity protein Tli4 family protein [Duganella sp. Root1480D1]|uniref:T6SS immunity protein Tli4 family protein n=1 Tax=Duganella sp. Root1480D1 TaxID=1736471 RepID=UPI00070DB903|nr:T6SS immunity protein Tli4 family protein [Duganella sp. Root1480D1]KQZ34200.1 hypothetical protein ASD58_28965 [Duganella sp. Root1480D1]
MPKFKLSPGRILFAVIGTLVAIQLFVNIEREREMIAEIKSEPSSIVCIGRTLVELPMRLVISYGMTYFAGWHIDTKVESEVDFQKRLQGRLEKLAFAKNEYGHRSLEFSKDVGGEWSGQIIQFDRESLKSVENGVVSYEDIVKIEGYLNAKGISFDISAGVNFERDLVKLEHLISRMKVRDENEIPSESGFCFDRGIIVGNENPTLSEGITLFAGYPNSNDVAVVIDSTAGTKAPDTLLQRVAGSSARKEFPSSFKNLRIGSRQINEHIGEEVLTRVIEDDGRSNHNFVWESIPEKKDVYHPQITMEFSTGFNNVEALNRTPFTDSEAIALWDRITTSLRNRPFTTSANPAN